MAAVLSNQGGYYSAAVYISEAQRLGIKVLLPSVNKSVYEYAGSGKEIRIGLMAIKNLVKNVIDKIIMEREQRGSFSSLSDFLKRTQLTYEQTEILIKCGAMDCLGQTRPTLLRLIDLYFSHRKLILGNGSDLFENETVKLEKEIVTLRQFSADEMCVREYEAFGYMITKHPLEFFAQEIDAPGVVKASEMMKYHNRVVKMIGWYMTSKRIKTSKGEIMKFLSLEDLSGTFEAVIFPNAYQKYAELTISMGPYFVEGRVDALNGNNIIVENLSVLAAEKARSITYRVLKSAGLLNRWNKVKKSIKGNGFDQPTMPHQHWHANIKYVNFRGTFLFLISVIYGYSRYIVHHELRTNMQEYDVQITIQLLFREL